jgi:hypothetical protein
MKSSRKGLTNTKNYRILKLRNPLILKEILGYVTYSVP